MSYTNTYFRGIASTVLFLFLTNIFVPTLQNTFAVGTNYYLDITNGNDGNDGSLGSPWQTIAKVNASLFTP